MTSIPDDTDSKHSVRPPSTVLVYILLGVLMTTHGLLLLSQIVRSTPTLDEVAHLPAGQTYVEQATFRMYRHSPPLARWVAAVAAWPTHPELLYERTWKVDEPANHWRFAFEVIANNAMTAESRGKYLASFTWGRCAIALWSVLTIPFLFAWGSQWFGRWAGLLAATLWTLSPNILAHAGLVTTDLAATSAGLIACWTFSRWLDRPTWSTFASAGIALGVAQLVKFSSLWLYFIFAFWLAAMLVASLFRNRRSKMASMTTPSQTSTIEPSGQNTKRAKKSNTKGVVSSRELPIKNAETNSESVNASKASIRQSLLGFIAIVLVSIFVIDVGYLFEGVGSPLGEFPFLSQTLTRPRQLTDGPIPTSNNTTYRQVWQERTNRFQGTLLAYVPVPLPYHFVAGFDEQKFEAEGKYPMYLRGKFADPLPAPGAAGEAPPARRGWWYYYLYALAIKVPLSTWILLALAIPLAFIRPAIRSIVPLLYLALAPILAMSFLTDINLGLRYVLPALPFIFLLCGSLVAVGRPRWTYVVAGLAVLWNVGVIARIHPHELSYFNEIVGGPTEGRFHLIDSNIDWGQDLRGLARWLDEHPDWKKEVKIGYAGTISPEFEGIENYRLAPRDLRFVPDFRLLPWEKRSDTTTWGPLPGKYAISVNFERGMRFHTPCPLPQFVGYKGKLGNAALPGSWMIEVPSGSYAYFQHFTPRIEPGIGYSILLYDISKDDANRVRKEMGLLPLP